ncbi:MAG TPA: START domain-containing protein [Polyangia bacterium]
MRALASLLLLAVQLGDIDAPGGWAVWATRDGVTVERRRPEGSRYYEHRAVVDVDGIAPARAAEEIWRSIHAGDMDSLKHRDILSERADELVIYDQIRTPVVSDRDYTVIVRRYTVGARTWFDCHTANERGPAPKPGLVRIQLVAAGWYVEPDGHGGTRLGYFAYSEPGGAVPAFLVRGAQADRSVADVVRMIKRLRAAR